MTRSSDGAARRIQDARYELASVDEIHSLQLSRLTELLRRVWATNPFYRRLWAGAGLSIDAITSLEQFRRAVPMVEKADFVADQQGHPPFGERIQHALSLDMPMDFYTTSGTSGQGVELHAQTADELRGMCELYAFGFRWSGLRPPDRVALTLPVTMLAGGRVEMQGATSYGLSVLPIGNYDVERKLTVLEQFKPVALLGSTTYFAHLAAHCPAPAELGVRTLLTGLEGVGFTYLERLQDSWQATAYDRFGCAQMRSDFMFSCEHGVGTADRPGLLHTIEPLVLVEVIDPETGVHVADGEYGEIVVTSLYHDATPIIRCRLRDGGVYRSANYCTCGRPFAGVEVSSISRTDDVKKIKGVTVFPQAVEQAVLSVAAVDEYEVLLISAGDATDIAQVTIMLKGGLDPASHADVRMQVSDTLRRAIGIGFKVAIGDVARSEYKARRWRDERSRS